jgi:hypothetical protein
VFDVLWVLVESRGALVTKEELFRRVWGKAMVEENTLSRAVSTLRQGLDDRAAAAPMIATVSGFGYRLAVPVVTIPSARPRSSHQNVNAEAHQLYLRGRAQLSRAGIDGLQAAGMEYLRSQDLPGDRDMCEHLAVLRAWSRGESGQAEIARYLAHQSVRLPVLHEVHGCGGDKGRASELLVGAVGAAEYQVPFKQVVLAWWLARHESWNASLAALRSAYLDGGYTNVSFLWLPIFAPLRADAGFGELLRRWKLAPVGNR